MIVFIDESGLSERPTRVRTWAAKGQTPVIRFHFNWTHISIIAGLSRTNFMIRLHEGSIKQEQHVEFLKALRAHLRRRATMLAKDLVTIGRRCAQPLKRKPVDHAELPYDDRGIPR